MKRLRLVEFFVLFIILWSLVNLRVSEVSAAEYLVIHTDGRIIGPEGIIAVNGDVYTLLCDYSGRIEIRRSFITFDGNGHTISQVTRDQGIILSEEFYPDDVFMKLKNVIVKNVRVENCKYGISVSGMAENCKIENCTVIGNTVVGIDLGGRNCSVSKCTVTGNVGHGINLGTGSHIIENNDITNNDMCGIVVTRENNRIVNNRIAGNKQHGIIIDRYTAKNNVVERNLIAGNLLNGITIFRGSQNNLSNNSITQNYGHGILLKTSNLNIVKENMVNNNTLAGISVVENSASNTIANNTLTRNKWLGMHVDSSSGNIIYGNVFNENGQVNGRQAQSMASVNQWDNGYPNGGNYWSDYEGADMYSGPGQDQPGGDGIGDTPYIINSERDRYPIFNASAIIIQSDGTVSPSNAPIDQYGSVYTLNKDVRQRIIVYRSQCLIDGNGHTVSSVNGPAIYVEASNVTVTNFMILKCGTGINVYGGKNNKLKNNEVAYCSEHGILLVGTTNNIVEGNKASFNGRSGILLDNVHNSTVILNEAVGNLEDGINIINSVKIVARGNQLIENHHFGLVLVSSKECVIGRAKLSEPYGEQLNNISSNYFDGIYVAGSSKSLILNNKLYYNGRSGICLESSHDIGVGENEVVNNTLDGIALHRSSGNILSWNSIKGGRHGVLLYESTYNYLEWIITNWANSDGVSIDRSSSNNLDTIIIINCTGNGLVIFGGSSFNTCTKIGTLHAGGQGILIHGSDNNNLLEAIANGSSRNGLLMAAGSSNNKIEDGRFINNAENGILLDSSSNNHISYSKVGNNSGVGICLWHSSSNHLSTNTVGNNSIDGMRLDHSDKNTIEKSVFRNNKCGIVFSESSGNLLIANKVAENREMGILLEGSLRNTLTHNYVEKNLWPGIVLVSSLNNTVTENILQNNGERGVWLHQAASNLFSSNIITKNSGWGIWVSGGSSGNTFTTNTVSFNEYAIFMDESSGNKIHHNSFFNNTRTASGVNSRNIWDDGYPSGGNFWSDYGEIDVYRGKNQDETGSDGLGDKPYIIDAENVDHYPLVNFTGDVSVTDLKVVQVVLDPPVIIVNKKAALYIEVYSSFIKNVEIEVEVTYGFGEQAYIEKGKEGRGIVIEPGVNRIYIPGGPAYPNCSLAWLEPDKGVFLYWNTTGVDNNIQARLDPEDKIKEINEKNNEKVISKKIIETKPLKVLVKSFYFPEIGQKPYNITAESAAKYLLEIYPVSEDSFECVQSKITPMPGIPPEDDYLYTEWLYNKIALPQSISAKLAGYDRVVLVINNTGHPWSGLAIGMLRKPDNQIPVFVDYSVFNATKGWMELRTVAHEIGHTFYLWHPHDIGPPVYRSVCYCVASRIYETEMNTFMSYIEPPNWIDPGRYFSDPKALIQFSSETFLCWNLLDQFKTGEDPEVIIVNGVLCRNQTVKADYPWYYMKNGTVDPTLGQAGDYSIVMLDKQNQILGSFYFNASFTYFLDVNRSLIKASTETVPFIFSVPYTAGTSRIEIRNATGAVLASKAVSANAPTVHLIFPKGGETVKAGSECIIKWQGSDSDGDKLVYTVMYSQNNGKTWVPLATNLDQTSYVWNTANLAEGADYRVKVLACDGVNVGEGISDPTFSISDQPSTNGDQPSTDGDQSSTNLPFWQQTWFIVAIVALAAILLLIIILKKR